MVVTGRTLNGFLEGSRNKRLADGDFVGAIRVVVTQDLDIFDPVGDGLEERGGWDLANHFGFARIEPLRTHA
jgi:hypothetical protein